MPTRSEAFKLPEQLADALDFVCRKKRLRKSAVIEAAVREKLEDLLDAEDLRGAVREAGEFYPWPETKTAARKAPRK